VQKNNTFNISLCKLTTKQKNITDTVLLTRSRTVLKTMTTYITTLHCYVNNISINYTKIGIKYVIFEYEKNII